MLVDGAAVEEVAQRAGGQPAGGARGERGGAEQRAGPQRGGGGEPVAERAALVDGGAGAVEQPGVVGQVGVQAPAVAGGERRVGGQVGVQGGVQVQRPAVVVVDGARAAVGVPAVAQVPAVDALQAAVDRGVRGPGVDADLGEEAADGEREQPPVVVDRLPVQGLGEPGAGAFLDGGGEAVPEPAAGQAQADGDRGGLHHGLAAVGDGAPGGEVAVGEVALGGGGAGAGVEARGVALQQAGGVVAVRAGHPDRGEQEGAGVALQAVRAAAGPAGAGAGQVDQGVGRSGVRADGREQPVGGGLPVGPGPTGVRAERAVLRREGERVRHGGLGSCGRGVGAGYPADPRKR